MNKIGRFTKITFVYNGLSNLVKTRNLRVLGLLLNCYLVMGSISSNCLQAQSLPRGISKKTVVLCKEGREMRISRGSPLLGRVVLELARQGKVAPAEGRSCKIKPKKSRGRQARALSQIKRLKGLFSSTKVLEKKSLNFGSSCAITPIFSQVVSCTTLDGKTGKQEVAEVSVNLGCASTQVGAICGAGFGIADINLETKIRHQGEDRFKGSELGFYPESDELYASIRCESAAGCVADSYLITVDQDLQSSSPSSLDCNSPGVKCYNPDLPTSPNPEVRIPVRDSTPGVNGGNDRPIRDANSQSPSPGQSSDIPTPVQEEPSPTYNTNGYLNNLPRLDSDWPVL